MQKCVTTITSLSYVKFKTLMETPFKILFPQIPFLLCNYHYEFILRKI
jgi:hypothetical protein